MLLSFGSWQQQHPLQSKLHSFNVIVQYVRSSPTDLKLYERIAVRSGAQRSASVIHCFSQILFRCPHSRLFTWNLFPCSHPHPFITAPTPTPQVRNSWGQYWGEVGFFKLARGINNQQIEAGDCWYADPTWEVERDVKAGKLIGSMYGLKKPKHGNDGEEQVDVEVMEEVEAVTAGGVRQEMKIAGASAASNRKIIV